MRDGRFAPTPTGSLHLGNLRTALVAWLFARASGGRFRIRIEDLDPIAARPGMAEEHLADLEALGLHWDPPVMWQSARRDAHEAAFAALRDAGLVYPCYCTRREIQEAASAPHGANGERPYPGTCRELDRRTRARREAEGRRPAWRLAVNDVSVRYRDRFHGELEARVDDFVVRRNDGIPAYNLAVVVDDHEQLIGEVVRGDDLLPTTHRQVHVASLLGLRVPAYAHVPLVVGADGQRLAKRERSITLRALQSAGWEPGAVLGLLGSSLGLCEPSQRVSAETLLARFDPDAVPRQPWALPAQLA